jgi:uncharacterized membrane protein YhhN
MTTTSWILLGVTFAFAFTDWWATWVGRTTVRYVAKPATLVALIGVAVTLDPADPTIRAWMVAGLVLSLAGDVFLMLDEKWFVAGLVSFLLGHIAYIVGLHVEGVDGPRFLVGIVLVMAVLAVLGTAILRGVRAGPDPGLAGPVVAYMFVISAMVASAIGVGNIAAIAGASLFYVSDALIAWNRFVRETRHAHVSIMVTYHLAQVGLVLSLV